MKTKYVFTVGMLAANKLCRVAKTSFEWHSEYSLDLGYNLTFFIYL